MEKEKVAKTKEAPAASPGSLVIILVSAQGYFSKTSVCNDSIVVSISSFLSSPNISKILDALLGMGE